MTTRSLETNRHGTYGALSFLSPRASFPLLLACYSQSAMLLCNTNTTRHRTHKTTLLGATIYTFHTIGFNATFSLTVYSFTSYDEMK
jgi:hypothetical protein